MTSPANIQVTFEPLGAIYIRFATGRVHRTIELVQDAVNIDVDQEKKLLGIEVLQPGLLTVSLRKLERGPYTLPDAARKMDYRSLEKVFASVGA